MSLFAAFQDPVLARSLSARIRDLPLTRTLRFMEVCGGHTAAIYKYGLRTLLPDSIELVSGPGCPVCVTPNEFIDRAVSLAQLENVTVATFGDLLRVPGTSCSLAEARGHGARVKIVYSPNDALELARTDPNNAVVFLAIGFETTACVIADATLRAAESRITNFKLLCALKTMPQALRALLSDPNVAIDGLILPGHVTTVTGISTLEFIPCELGIACSVSGFEPVDLLESILELAEQTLRQEPLITNRYSRSVRPEGNTIAQQMIDRAFEPSDVEWRGLGMIPQSGLALRPEYAEHDAGALCRDTLISRENSACRCGEVLRGAIHPTDCALFGTVCAPDTPVGACMVSSEGACAAVFQYQAASEY